MSDALHSMLERLKGVRQSGDGFTALCPAHDDHKNSLSVKRGDDGRVLLYCFAGCTIEQITTALGIEVTDLFERGFRPTCRRPLTIQDLADDKKLPADLLLSLGLEEREDGVVIPYRHIDGSLAPRSRLRTACRANGGSFWIPGKGKPVPYGLDRLQEARVAGYVVVVEGESDSWTLWHHGFPALGIPGADMTGKLDAGHVDGLSRIYVIDEGGKAGMRFIDGIAGRLARFRWKGEARQVRLTGAKDPNELHQLDPDGFATTFRSALDRAEVIEIGDPPPPQVESRDVGGVLTESGVSGLTSTSSPDEIDATLRRFAEAVRLADPLKRALLRQAAVDHLSAVEVRGAAKLVDSALKVTAGEPNGAAGSDVFLEDPEPCDERVDGEEVLNAVADTISRHLSLPAGGIDAISLWILLCYAFEHTVVGPILAITSPNKRCGKTTLLEIVAALVPRALLASNITTAALFRSIEKFRPTLLIDEADTFIAKNDDLRGVINAGHYRSTAKVIRSVGDDNEPRIFSTWCPKAIALIGRLRDTLQDRSIHIAMRRRRPEERVVRLRRDCIQDELRDLRGRLARLASDVGFLIKDADPDPLDGLNDRALDNWRPLLALADAIGGNWPERARQAATAIESAANEAESTTVIQLLADIRQIFEADGAEILATDEILKPLHAMEDRPWGEWGKAGNRCPSNSCPDSRSHLVYHRRKHIDGERNYVAIGWTSLRTHSRATYPPSRDSGIPPIESRS